MKYERIMIRYGELTLKGKNKNTFIDTLANNIHQAFTDMPNLKYEKQYDRFYLKFAEDANIREIENRLKQIPGIHKSRSG